MATGEMNATFYWPVYGKQDEVCFPWFPSRAAEHVYCALGLTPAQGSVLLADGYAAYTQYAEKTGVTHEQCWAHLRRTFFKAQPIEPELGGEALEQIRTLYAVEEKIRERKLLREHKRVYRLVHARPIVDTFFDWITAAEEAFRQQTTPLRPAQRSGYAITSFSYRARL